MRAKRCAAKAAQCQYQNPNRPHGGPLQAHPAALKRLFLQLAFEIGRP